jgi:hypothetical protein
MKPLDLISYGSERILLRRELARILEIHDRDIRATAAGARLEAAARHRAINSRRGQDLATEPPPLPDRA